MLPHTLPHPHPHTFLHHHTPIQAAISPPASQRPQFSRQALACLQHATARCCASAAPRRRTFRGPNLSATILPPFPPPSPSQGVVQAGHDGTNHHQGPPLQVVQQERSAISEGHLGRVVAQAHSSSKQHNTARQSHSMRGMVPIRYTPAPPTLPFAGGSNNPKPPDITTPPQRPLPYKKNTHTSPPPTHAPAPRRT